MFSTVPGKLGGAYATQCSNSI